MLFFIGDLLSIVVFKCLGFGFTLLTVELPGINVREGQICFNIISRQGNRLVGRLYWEVFIFLPPCFLGNRFIGFCYWMAAGSRWRLEIHSCTWCWWWGRIQQSSSCAVPCWCAESCIPSAAQVGPPTKALSRGNCLVPSSCSLCVDSENTCKHV